MYEEFPPEWEDLELWEVQIEKYSRIGQLGGTSDKEEHGEGELGSYRPDPPLLQERKNPVFRNPNSMKIMRNSQNEEFVCKTVRQL